MKPTAYMYKLPHESRWHGIRFADSILTDEVEGGVWSEVIQEPLYTAHEIASFIRKLYFDDNFRLDDSKNRFAQIADKIEEEAKKND